MSDKAANSHIERTVYVSPSVKPGDSITYGDWNEKSDLMWEYRKHDQFGPVLDSGHYVHGQPLTIIERATGSDYSGNLVEISNARCLKRDFPWLVEIYGSHGTRGVAYLGKRENQNDALIEAIDSLTDYPVYSDDDHSSLECDRESECWSEPYGGEHDFKRALASYFDEIDEDHEHDADSITDALIASAGIPRRYHADTLSSVFELWREGCEAFNVNGGSGYVNEQGDSIYFMIDDWIDGARKPNYPGWSDSFKAAHDSMRETLVQLATTTRVVSDDTQPEQGV